MGAILRKHPLSLVFERCCLLRIQLVRPACLRTGISVDAVRMEVKCLSDTRIVLLGAHATFREIALCESYNLSGDILRKVVHPANQQVELAETHQSTILRLGTELHLGKV